MKILGIGIDIIENKRIKNSIKIIDLKREFIVQKNLDNPPYQKIRLDIFLNDLQLKKLLLKLWVLALEIT